MVAWDRDVEGRWGCLGELGTAGASSVVATPSGGAARAPRPEPLPGLLGNAPAMLELARIVRRSAPLRAP